MCACMCVCVHTHTHYIYMYIRTYTHTQLLGSICVVCVGIWFQAWALRIIKSLNCLFPGTDNSPFPDLQALGVCSSLSRYNTPQWFSPFHITIFIDTSTVAVLLIHPFLGQIIWEQTSWYSIYYYLSTPLFYFAPWTIDTRIKLLVYPLY